MADIGNTTKCSRANCGHPGSMHADIASGENSGKCSGKNAGAACTCPSFQTASDSAAGQSISLGTQVVGPVAAPAEVSTDGPAFEAVLIQEGVDTQDGRHIAPHALSWRELPLSLMVLTETGPGGHQGAVIGARIDEIERVAGTTPGTFDILGRGHLDTGPTGLEATRLIGNQTLRGVSGDLVDVESTVEVLAEDEDGWPTAIKETVTSGVLAAATVCPIPAFAGCTIRLVDETAAPAEAPAGAPALVASAQLPAFTVEAVRCLPCEDRASTAVVASGGPLAPPAAWFAAPDLDGPTPLTIADSGRVFGHLAAWGTCHTGITGRCITPPRSQSNYAGFALGAVQCSDGTVVATGPLTYGGGHADTSLSIDDTRAHYDDTTTAFADVAVGEDAHGIWVAGALRPDVDDVTVRKVRASTLSGDWRPQGARLELVAALAVNTPGFPIARVASGQPVAIVAAGAHALTRTDNPDERIEQRLAALQRSFEEALAPMRAQELLRRIRRTPTS